eukprot:192636-Prymnesium_polylepis.1
MRARSETPSSISPWAIACFDISGLPSMSVNLLMSRRDAFLTPDTTSSSRSRSMVGAGVRVLTIT